MSAPRKYDAVVVGAGLAGLAAALELEAAGLNVVVLEANDRVGGRIHSMRQLGSNAEAGGTYIGAGYERIFALTERFGIRLIDVTPVLEFFREQDLGLDGELIRQSEWPTHRANVFPEADREQMPWTYHRLLAMRENPLETPDAWIDPAHADLDVSMHAWLNARGLSDEAVRIAYDLNPSFGSDARDVSALFLLFRAAFSNAQRRHQRGDAIGFTAEHGVQRIPDAMAGALAHGVELDRRVAAIRTDARSAEVVCADGTRLEAPHVVCSVPLAVLGSIAFEPALEGPQAEAVTAIPSQPITQVYLRPKSAFWEADGYAASLYTNSMAGMVAAVRSGTNPSEISHLSAWVMGRKAVELDRLAPADAGRTVIEAIETLRPAAAGRLELIGLTSWGGDAHAGGAWAYYRPGQVTRFAGRLGAAHGRVVFCGEHLATRARGMEGAVETGQRAAAEVVAAG